MQIFDLALLVSLASVISCREQTLNAKTGHISSNSNGDDLFQIPVAAGKVIVISVDYLKLNRYSSLMIRDGLDGNGTVYRMFGGRIYRTRVEDRSDWASVIPPIVIKTKTRRLIIHHKGVHVGRKEGFSARYTSYTEEGNCLKEELQRRYDDLTFTCDTDTLSPVASRCGVQCGEAYQQNRVMESCGTEGWGGSLKCQPKAEFIEECSYDFYNFTTNEGCPFSSDEVVQYYLEIEKAETPVFSLVRSGGGRKKKKKSCQQLCAKYSNGRYTQRCSRGQPRYPRCMVCRSHYRCSVNNYYFG